MIRGSSRFRSRSPFKAVSSVFRLPPNSTAQPVCDVVSLLAGSALTLATGIWSMHFVGMLAASFPSAIDYLVLPTLASFLICVIVVGLGVYAAHAPQPPKLRIGLGAVAMGLGISTMHYVGMRAVHLAGPDHPGGAVRRRLGPRVDRGERLCADGARQPAEPPASVPRRGRAGAGDLRHALHRHGRHAPRSAVLRRQPLRRGGPGAVAQHAGAACDRDRLRRLRRLPAVAGARR